MHRGSSRYSDVRSFRLCPLFSIFEFLANFTIVSKLSDITEQSHINHNKQTDKRTDRTSRQDRAGQAGREVSERCWRWLLATLLPNQTISIIPLQQFSSWLHSLLETFSSKANIYIFTDHSIPHEIYFNLAIKV